MEMNGVPVKSPKKTSNGVGRFLMSLVNNVFSRAKYISDNSDRRRDYYEEFGWIKHDPEIKVYQDTYDRNPIAQRIVRVMPRETWKSPPDVFEKDRNQINTPFEEAWRDLNKSLQISDPGVLNEENLHQDQKGGAIWEILRRADVLSGIGRYGVILLGLDDVTDTYDMSNQVVTTSPRKLLYMNAFPESLARISKIETNQNSKRFGQPTEYEITFNSVDDVSSDGTTRTLAVHWTRIIHLADNVESSSTHGVPRLKAVINDVQDIQFKLMGGSAEMFWQGAMPITSFETDPSLGGDVDIDGEDVKDQWEQLINGMQRVLALRGVTAKQLAPTIVSPIPHIKARMDAIAIQLEIPIRILLGSERSDTSSSQDDARWNDVIYDRMINYASPRIIAPLINRLIAIRVLPRPSGYTIEWPDLSAQTAQEKARVSVSRTQAIVQYIKGQGWKVMNVHDFLTRIMNYTDIEASAIIESNKKDFDWRWSMTSDVPNDLPNAKNNQKDIDRQATMIGMNP